MYVKTFTGESLEDTLKQIKKELGPEAIILKTVTNKGAKRAFKKSRIEITAAVTEKQYDKKIKVDSVLNNDQKENFYKDKAQNISQMIDSFDQHRNPVKKTDYGQLSLNKSVKTKIRDELDDFLGKGSVKESIPKREKYEEVIPAPAKGKESLAGREGESGIVLKEEVFEDLLERLDKIDELEKKLDKLSQSVNHSMSKSEEKGPDGIYKLRSYLKSVDLNENFIQNLMKKAMSEFKSKKEELENLDNLLDFCLREMDTSIHTAAPLFSEARSEGKNVVTLFISDVSCGQTSLMYKIGNLKKDSLLFTVNPVGTVNPGKGSKKNEEFISSVLRMEILEASSLPEIISQCNKRPMEGKAIFIDYRWPKNDGNSLKPFVDGLTKSFARVEILLCLSAIHTEDFNRKMLQKYKDTIDGVCFSFLDECLNFSAIFNLHYHFPQLPIKFFGTGDSIPEDIEAASAERILSKIFGFK